MFLSSLSDNTKRRLRTITSYVMTETAVSYSFPFFAKQENLISNTDFSILIDVMQYMAVKYYV